MGAHVEKIGKQLLLPEWGSGRLPNCRRTRARSATVTQPFSRASESRNHAAKVLRAVYRREAKAERLKTDRWRPPICHDPRASDQNRRAGDRTHREYSHSIADELPAARAVPHRRARPEAVRSLSCGAWRPDEAADHGRSTPTRRTASCSKTEPATRSESMRGQQTWKNVARLA